MEISLSRRGFRGQYVGLTARVRSRDGKAAARFFRKALKADHTQSPQVINVDHNAAYPNAVDTLKDEQMLPKSVELRQNKYLNNVIEQDHRNIKRIVKPMMGFKSFNTARKTLRGIEAMNRVRKGQVIWNRTRGQCVSSQVY